MIRSAVASIVLFAASVPLCSAQTSTSPSRWYVTVSSGASFISDADATYAPPSGPLTSGKLELGNGFMAGGTIGWYLRPDIRIEADFNYRRNSLDSTSVPGLDEDPSGADYASVLIMANVFKDFAGWSTDWAEFKPYVGAGLGIAQEVDTDLEIGGVAREFSGDRRAWQVLAGVNWQYRSPWFAGVGLRYIDAGTLRLESSPPGLGEIKADYKGLALDVRLGYRF